ncbi:hypothetical protein EGW08_015814 [Elysia chlorotica]|uniref:BED-type domain-containing protein n=1 Tax=Elysia chlorotica TaxID=188477 RepID=A0A3S1B6W4_ELYCH|nr:hypothetical protein EGW08_015814 [Elysia chlorotica]
MSRRASLLAKQEKRKPRVRFPDELVFLDNIKGNDIQACHSMLRRASVQLDLNGLDTTETDMADSQRQTTPRRPRSIVWCYFDKVPNEPLNASCKVCHKVCHHAMNTSNLLKHLKVKHPETYRKAEEQRITEMELYLQLKAKSGKPVSQRMLKAHEPLPQSVPTPKKNPQPSAVPATVKPGGSGIAKKNFSPGPGRPKGGTNRPRQNMNKALVRMLAKDMIHPSMVTGRGFREFLTVCDARMEIPSKELIYKNLLPELVEETKLLTTLEVKPITSMTLSVESWFYKTSQSFVTVSVHFIKDNWTMSSFVLETFDCTDERTETNMATNLKRVTDEYGVTERVLALVSDAPDETLSSASLVNGWEQLTDLVTPSTVWSPVH